MTQMSSRLSPDVRQIEGLHVLVVEDLFLVAEVIADLLEDCGCQVIGPVSRVASALILVKQRSWTVHCWM